MTGNPGRKKCENNKSAMHAILLVGSPARIADMRYATGFNAPDGIVYLQWRSKKIMVVSRLEKGRAQRVARGVEVLLPEDLRLQSASASSLTEWALGLVRRLKLRMVSVAADFPLAAARRLEQAGIKVQIHSDALFPQRQIKTALELARMAESQAAAIKAIQAAIRLIATAGVDYRGGLRDGRKILTSESVRALINRVLLEENCVGADTIVAGGRQAVDPHEMGHGPLYAGELIVMDIFPRHIQHGYWGDLTRTVVKGTPSAKAHKLYLAVKAAHQAALAQVKAGIPATEVHAAALKVFKERGFETAIVRGRPQGFIHSTGHGVGLEIHEEPGIGPRGKAILQAGNVITIEPGLYYPGIGGARVEDLVVVTASGWRLLGRCSYRFQV